MSMAKGKKNKEIIIESKNGSSLALYSKGPGRSYVKILDVNGSVLDFMDFNFFKRKYGEFYNIPEKLLADPISINTDKKIPRKKLYKSIKEFFESVSNKDEYRGIVAEPGYQAIMDFIEEMDQK